MKKITRKEFAKRILIGSLPLALGARCASESPSPRTFPSEHLDLVITNARIIDGTAMPWFPGDVGIKEGKIADIGKIPASAATAVLDAGDRYLCPGFIDPHAHEEILLLANPKLEKFVRQGVTTIINGNCGHSVTPYEADKVLEYWWREALIDRKWLEKEDLQWEGVDGYARLVADRGGTGVNSAILLGYGGIRWGAMRGAHDRPPDEGEWKEIERLVREGLEEGAVGMSTGLSYIPARYASTQELIRVARVLAEQDSIYATHTRFGREGDPTGGLEAIEIGQTAECRVQISHFAGRRKGALEMVSQAHRQGLQVAADVIPSSLSHRRRSDRMVEALMVFYPGAFDYSLEELEGLLRESHTRKQVLENTRFFNNDKSEVVIVRAITPKYQPHMGKSVAELAKEQGKDAGELYVEMVLDRENPVVFTFDGDIRQMEGRSSRRSRRFREEELLPEGYWTTHPLFGPGSDSIPVDMEDPYGWYEQQRRGAFPAYLRLARKHNVPLEEAIMKATSLPARQFHLSDRGLISKGKVADLMVFDLDAYDFPTPEEQDPNEPFAMASGVLHVLVNGRPVLRDGELTGEMPGKVLI